MLQSYIDRQQNDADVLLHDTTLMRKLVLKNESLQEFETVAGKEYGVFLFAETISDNQDLLFWNNQKILPPDTDFNLPDGEYFQQLSNGYYIIRKSTMKFTGMSNSIVTYIMIPVLYQYYLETRYLLTQFAYSKEAVNKISLSTAQTRYSIRNLQGQPLFYIKRVAHTNVEIVDTLTIVLRLTALIFLLVYIHLLSETIVKRTRALYGVVFLIAVLVFLRGIMYAFPQLFSFRQFHLFDPTIYATNGLNRSLGDLLINCILVCWIVLFSWYNIGPNKTIPSFIKGKSVYAYAIVAMFILVFSTFQVANIIRSLVADSKISFNVTDFFSLDIYTVLGFIILALLSLTYYYFTRLLFRFIFPAFDKHQIYVYFFIALVGLIFLSFRSGNAIVLFYLPVLLWLIIYTLLVSQESFIINRFKITIAGVLFWIFVFSISLAAIILQGNRENELRVRKGIAEKV